MLCTHQMSIVSDNNRKQCSCALQSGRQTIGSQTCNKSRLWHCKATALRHAVCIVAIDRQSARLSHLKSMQLALNFKVLQVSDIIYTHSALHAAAKRALQVCVCVRACLMRGYRRQCVRLRLFFPDLTALLRVRFFSFQFSNDCVCHHTAMPVNSFSPAANKIWKLTAMASTMNGDRKETSQSSRPGIYRSR